MLNKIALQDKIQKCGFTLESFAAELGMSYTTLYRKINGNSDFTRAEIQDIKRILKLTNSETLSIFFKEKLA
jgi:predicted transcriptional regulator